MKLLTLITFFIVNAEIPAKISYLVGSVTIQRQGIEYVAKLNTPLYTDDIVTTYDGWCEIQFLNYSLIRIEPNSSMKIERNEETKKGIFQRFFAQIGEIVTKVTKLNQDDEYEIRTDAAHAFIRGTTFKTEVTKDGTTAFSVIEGKIAVRGLIEGAKEILLDENFKTKLARGELAPIAEKVPLNEIEGFKAKYKEFIDRGKILENLRGRLEKELQEKKEGLIKKSEKKLKGCLF